MTKVLTPLTRKLLCTIPLLVGTAWPLGSAHALALSVRCDSQAVGTIIVNSVVGGISGGFFTNPGFTIATAANACDIDHFNWAQTVTSDNFPPNNAANNPLAAPYRDPPSGGYSNQLADNLQWYWDEGNVNVGTGYNLNDPGNVTLNSLLFVDYPKSPQANTVVDFTTRLVGVGALGQGLAALGPNFKWTWKGGGGACGNVNLRRNITPPGCGDTSDIAELPEPATLVLVLFGAVALLFPWRSVKGKFYGAVRGHRA